MKIISIFFSVVLVFPIAYFFSHILELYDRNGTLKTFGVSNELVDSLATPYFIFMAIYFAAFLAAIFFNIKKKYITNSIFSGAMMVFYMITAILGLQWLK